jgi:hypothetical protein
MAPLELQLPLPKNSMNIFAKVCTFLSIISLGETLVSYDVGQFNGSCRELGLSFLSTNNQRLLSERSSNNYLSLMEMAPSLPRLNFDDHGFKSKLSQNSPEIMELTDKLLNIFKSNPPQLMSDEITLQVNELYTSYLDHIGFEGFFLALGEAMKMQLKLDQMSNDDDDEEFTFITSKSRRVSKHTKYNTFTKTRSYLPFLPIRLKHYRAQVILIGTFWDRMQ